MVVAIVGMFLSYDHGGGRLSLLLGHCYDVHLGVEDLQPHEGGVQVWASKGLRSCR